MATADHAIMWDFLMERNALVTVDSLLRDGTSYTSLALIPYFHSHSRNKINH